MTGAVEHIPTIADAEQEIFEEEIIPEAEGIAAGILWIVALVALLGLPLATQPGRRPLGWFQEPGTWPFIALLVALLGGAALLLRLFRLSRQDGFRQRAMSAFQGMGSALTYGFSFLIFLVGVSFLGFTISSLLFMQALYYISGLRGGKWPWIALAVATTVVLAFRIGLGIWFPLPPMAEFLPDWVGNKLGAYL